MADSGVFSLSCCSGADFEKEIREGQYQGLTSYGRRTSRRNVHVA